MYSFFSMCYNFLITLGTYLQPLILLAVRLVWGWAFFKAGKSKIEGIDPVIEFFVKLGIPYAAFNAYAVAWIECIGGLLLMAGLASRLAAVSLTVIMLVALFTAHQDVAALIFTDPLAFTAKNPFSYLFASLLIFAFGPGAISIDGLLKTKLQKT